MNKFESYNASQIVPQRTLLEKFNKLVEYLSKNPTVNLFFVNVDYTGNIYNKSDIVNNGHQLELGDIIVFKNCYYSVVSSIGETTFAIINATSFKGESGATGATGPQGPQGIQGIQGPQGIQGIQGPQGLPGGSVAVMVDAESCTEIGDGYINSDGDLMVLTNLSPREFTNVGKIRGPKGETGATGPQGPQGPQGIQGETGPQGETGATGATGETGPQGVSISTVSLNSSNQFVITLSNGNTITTSALDYPLENIKDSNARNRFVEGGMYIYGEVTSGIHLTYGRWSLSGTHLLIVVAGYIEGGTTLPDGNRIFGVANLPSWIHNKIIPLYGNLCIYNQDSIVLQSWSRISIETYLNKETNNELTIRPNGTISVASGNTGYYRLQFDLLIDND